MAQIPYPNGLAKCMARAGVNDPWLAEQSHTSKQQIHKLRHGERKLTVQWAKRLAPFLHAAWQELIDGPLDQVGARRAELLSLFDSADGRDQETLLLVAKGLHRDPEASAAPAPTPVDPPVTKRQPKVLKPGTPKTTRRSPGDPHPSGDLMPRKPARSGAACVIPACRLHGRWPASRQQRERGG